MSFRSLKNRLIRLISRQPGDDDVSQLLWAVLSGVDVDTSDFEEHFAQICLAARDATEHERTTGYDLIEQRIAAVLSLDESPQPTLREQNDP